MQKLFSKDKYTYENIIFLIKNKIPSLGYQLATIINSMNVIIIVI